MTDQTQTDRKTLERLKALPSSRRLEILEEQMMGLLNLLTKYGAWMKTEAEAR